MTTTGGREIRRSRRFARITALFAAALLSALALAAADSADSRATTPPPADKAEIFFVNGGRIVSIKSDGTDREVLTRKHGSVSIFSRVSDSAPLPSPDGQTVLFTRTARSPGKSGVMAIDHEGGPVRRILGFKADPDGILPQYSAVDWSADGSRFFAFRFQAIEKDKSTTVVRTSLLSVRTDGGGIRNLYSTSVTFSDEKRTAGDRWIPIDASVTPNGKTALLAVITLNPGSKMRLARINLATGKRTWLAKNTGQADIGPDGRTVVFTSERDKLNESCYDGFCSYQPKLYLINLDGTNLRRVITPNQEGSYWSPDFSPDGSRIVFTADRETRRSWFGTEIWSVKKDGSCLTRLTNGSPRSGEAAWGAGSLTGPGTCGEADLRPVVDVTYPRRAETMKPRQMWLGRKYDNLLLSETWTAHKSLSSYFADCGALDIDDCPGMISVRSTQVCGAGIGNELTSGFYGGMESLRGGLVLDFGQRGPYGDGLSTHLLTGGIDVSIEAETQIGVKPVSRRWRRAAIDRLRYVGADAPPASYHRPVFADRTIRAAHRLLHIYRRTGSLRQAAIGAGLFGARGRNWRQVVFQYERKGALSWLRFARDLKKIGSFGTVGCPK